VGPWGRAAGRVSGRSHGRGGGGDGSNDCDPAAAVHVLVAVSQITAARMPAAMLDAAGAGGVACSNEERLALVVTPTDRRRGLTAATTAAPAPGTPLAVAAATSPPSTAVLLATHRFASAAVASTAGPEEAAKGVGATAVAAGRSSDIRQEEVAASAAARMARRGGGGGCGPLPDVGVGIRETGNATPRLVAGSPSWRRPAVTGVALPPRHDLLYAWRVMAGVPTGFGRLRLPAFTPPAVAARKANLSAAGVASALDGVASGMASSPPRPPPTGRRPGHFSVDAGAVGQVHWSRWGWG